VDLVYQDSPDKLDLL